MIDRQSGDVILSQGKRLGASTTRSEFLASVLGRNAKKFVANPPYCSYRVETELLGGERFLVILFFNSERMEAVWLISLDASPAASDEFGPEAEKAEFERKESHDRWLTAALGSTAPPPFAWGSALSAYDSRSMSSQIVVRYNQAAEEPASPARTGNSTGGSKKCSPKARRKR